MNRAFKTERKCEDQGTPDLGVEAEDRLERISYRKWSCKISGDLAGKQRWPWAPGENEVAVSTLHVPCCHRAVCHWKTHSLVFGAPKARRNWHGAMAALIKTEFALRNCSRLHQRTQPHWEKG